MTTLQGNLVRYIDEQLDAIERRPRMWGPDLCVELQYLQLLEFRSATLRPELERQDPRAVLDEFARFLALNFPGAPPLPLTALLAESHRERELVAFLREFRRMLIIQMGAESAGDAAQVRPGAIVARRQELGELPLPRLTRKPPRLAPPVAGR
ncbi:hypothetical protein [Chondromyces apiculatus]|uniref:hypothetical protein n=1 Tax=Chondromyces apiculatus TaxID=51 RepID=UPI0005C60235|nr:hypothetical protein [Chondromyces apiculatus]